MHPSPRGKTTLAEYLAGAFPNKYVLVETAQDLDGWQLNLERACVDETFVGEWNAREAVRALQRANKAIIIDEGHILFSCPEMYANLTKSWKPKIKMLLFSAAATGRDANGNLVATPVDITKKYLWYPPVPRGEVLVDPLKEAGVFLDAPSVDFMLKVCCGHRGNLHGGNALGEGEARRSEKEEPQQLFAGGILDIALLGYGIPMLPAKTPQLEATLLGT